MGRKTVEEKMIEGAQASPKLGEGGEFVEIHSRAFPEGEKVKRRADPLWTAKQITGELKFVTRAHVARASQLSLLEGEGYPN